MIDLLETVWWYCNAGVQMYGLKAWCLVGTVENEFLHPSLLQEFHGSLIHSGHRVSCKCCKPTIGNFRLILSLSVHCPLSDKIYLKFSMALAARLAQQRKQKEARAEEKKLKPPGPQHGPMDQKMSQS